MNQDGPSAATDSQEEAWILEKEKESAAEDWRRFRKALGWTIVAAFAATIAAAASVVAIIRYWSER